MIPKKVLILLLAGIVLFLCMGAMCGSTDSAEGGSGSEIVGNVEDGDSTTTARAAMTAAGIPIPYCPIYLYATTLDTNLLDLTDVSVWADKDGNFRITDVPLGTWIVEAHTVDGRKARVTINVNVPDTVYQAGTLRIKH